MLFACYARVDLVLFVLSLCYCCVTMVVMCYFCVLSCYSRSMYVTVVPILC